MLKSTANLPILAAPLNELFTTSALLTLAGVALVTVARLIERWWDLQAAKGDIELVLRAYTQSPKGGKAVTDLAKADLRISGACKPLDPSKLSGRPSKL